MNKHLQYERVFDHFDINGDRKISPSELQQCVEAIGGGEELSLAEAEAAVEFLDSDGDGLLGFDDFVRFVEGGGEEEKLNDLKEAFKMYIEMDDGCGCGCITPKSLRRMLSRLGQSKSVDQCVEKISTKLLKRLAFKVWQVRLPNFELPSPLNQNVKKGSKSLLDLLKVCSLLLPIKRGL